MMELLTGVKECGLGNEGIQNLNEGKKAGHSANEGIKSQKEGIKT
ncbi:hypothetical protein [Jeotgalibacillus sp. R-1-5s-1]|nr:hypothetical protein [Jeotgalibacillus sp. R-1-5s-1]